MKTSLYIRLRCCIECILHGFHEYDLRVLIDTETTAEHLKRIYVAMTRPTDLLCLAVLDEHIKNGDLQALEKLGWAIKGSLKNNFTF